jgi:hypothetical protein
MADNQRIESAKCHERAPTWLELATRVFLPFAFAYFFSDPLHNINTAIAAQLVDASQLIVRDEHGLLTAAYFSGFAAMQASVGAWLDRYIRGVLHFLLYLVAAVGAASRRRQRRRFRSNAHAQSIPNLAKVSKSPSSSSLGPSHRGLVRAADRIFLYVSTCVARWGDAYDKTGLYSELCKLSDEELERRGIARGDLWRHVDGANR